MIVNLTADDLKKRGLQQPTQIASTPIGGVPMPRSAIKQAKPAPFTVAPTEDTSIKGWFEKHPWLRKTAEMAAGPLALLNTDTSYYDGNDTAKSLVSGLTDTVRQPARAMQQFGEAVGTYGQSEDTKRKVHEFIMSGSEMNPAGVGEPVQNAEEAAGVGLQTAANLATPFIRNPLTMAAQGAALTAGKEMENDGSARDVATSGIVGGLTSAAVGKLTDIAGNLVSGGFKKLADAVGKTKYGLSDAEIGTIRKQPKIVEDYLNRLSSAGDDVVAQTRARQGIETDIYDQARDSWSKYADTAGKQYEKDMASHAKNIIPNMPSPDRSALRNDIVDLADQWGIEAIPVAQGRVTTEGGTDAQRAMIEKLFHKVKKAGTDTSTITGEIGWDQLNGLRKDVGNLYETVGKNDPEKKILDNFYAKVKEHMMSLSNDPAAVQKTFDAYKQFIENKASFKQLSSGKNDPMAMRQGYLELMRSLSGQKGTGDLASTVGEISRASGASPDDLMYKIHGLELAEKLSGVRSAGTAGAMAEDAIKSAMKNNLPTLGQLPTLAVKSMAEGALDKTFINSLFNQVKPGMTSQTRKAIGAFLEDPTVQTLIAKRMSGLLTGNE